MSTEVKQPKMISFCSAAHWRSVLCVVEMAIAKPNDIVIAIDPTGLMKKMFELRGKTDVLYTSSDEVMCLIDQHNQKGNRITMVVDYSDGSAWVLDRPTYNVPHENIVIGKVKGNLGKNLFDDIRKDRLNNVFAVLPVRRDNQNRLIPVLESPIFLNDLVIQLINVKEDNTTIVSNDKFVSRAIRSKYGICGEYKVLPNYIPNMVDENDILLEHLHPLLALPEVLEHSPI